MLFIAIHILLWLSWKLIAWQERYTRIDGLRVPFYWSGDIGDVVGFSLSFYVAGMFFNQETYLYSAIPAILITILFHVLWRSDARYRTTTVSMYFKDGTPTLAGRVHLLYVFVVLVVLLGTIASHSFWRSDEMFLALFFGGLVLYVVCVLIDWWRKVL